MSDTVQLLSSPFPGHRAGDVIAAKYRLERELGRGAMGTVWAATHTTLGQRVAIKLIAGEQAQSIDARQRFSVEAKAAARLRSRYVVAVYDDGETPDGTPYIVMEYLDGETLEQRLERQRDVSLGEAVRIATHVGRALARAHAQNIIHRDLKSGNIFLAKTDDDEIGWVAKVLDFGVAKLSDAHGPSTTKTGTIVGTPLFMSPEQIRGASHVDHRADLYSLGMVFYNMVTGSHAFDGPSYSDVLVSICTQTLPDIRMAAPWLPAPVRAWFDKACARERENRFQSADEMIEALLQAAGSGTRAPLPSAPDDVSGPSGTLLGYAAPEANATILQMDSASPNLSGRTELLAASSGTLRSLSSSHNAATARPPPSLSRGSLALWAASGVGLAVVAMLVATAVARVTAPAREPAQAETRAETEITNAGPPRELARPNEPVLAAPAAPPRAPTVTEPAPPPAAATDTKATSGAGKPAAREEPARNSAAAARARVQPGGASPRSPAAPAPAEPAARPPAGAAAPDMGF
jgi:eukaryotic-like serine/threonine-protein kinase